MKIMITNTSRRPECAKQVLYFFVATFGTLAPPIPKSWLRHWWAPTKKKSWAPLGLCPPPPPIQKLLPARLCYDLRAQGHNLLYRQTMWLINKILRRIVFQTQKYQQFRLARNQYNIAFSWFSGFLVGGIKKNPTRKYEHFGSLAIISGFFSLVSDFWSDFTPQNINNFGSLATLAISI